MKIIDQQDGERTLFYCDPPYLHGTRNSVGEYGNHEMTNSQHEELLRLLGKICGKFLLSGYHSELYDDSAAQHGWRSIERAIDNKASSAQKKEIKTEVLWANFE